MWCPPPSFFFFTPPLRSARKRTKTSTSYIPGSKWQAAGERREREDSLVPNRRLQSTELSRAPARLSLPAWCGSGIRSARTMLLVFGREGGHSFRNLDLRERWPLRTRSNHPRIPPNAHQSSEIESAFRPTKMA